MKTLYVIKSNYPLLQHIPFFIMFIDFLSICRPKESE